MRAEGSGVVVGLGSNLGRRRRELGRALLAMDRRFGLRRASAVYASPARGGGVSGEFLNLCVLLDSPPPPGELLEELLELEARAGRPRSGPARGGNRRLDLDLLLYGDRRIRRPGLVVPHPRLHERAFVLVPLRELGADRRVPGTGRSVAALAAEVSADELRRVCPGGELMSLAETEGTYLAVPGGSAG